MEIKNNDATRNRPYGERVLDAPAVLIHLPQYIQMIREEKAWEQNDRNGITVFKSDELSLVVTCLKKGAELEDVHTDGYSSLFVIAGSLRSQSGNDEKQIGAGDVLVFHPQITYSILAEEESSFLLSHYASDNNNGTNKFI